MGIKYKMYDLDNILIFYFILFFFPHQPPVAFNEVGVIGVIFGKGLKSEEMERCWAEKRDFL